MKQHLFQGFNYVCSHFKTLQVGTFEVFSIKHMTDENKRHLIFIHWEAAGCAKLVIDLAHCLLRAADSPCEAL